MTRSFHGNRPNHQASSDLQTFHFPYLSNAGDDSRLSTSLVTNKQNQAMQLDLGGGKIYEDSTL